MRKRLAIIALAAFVGLSSAAVVAEPAFAVTKRECQQSGGTFTKGTGGDPNSCTNTQPAGRSTKVTKGTVTTGKGSTKNDKGSECTGVFNPSGERCR